MDCLENSPVWHVDGTFKTSPKLYYQMFNIHAWFRDEMYQCATFFLKTKEEKTYYRSLQQLKNCAYNFDPQVILIINIK